MSAPLNSERHLFSLPDDVHYLNCAYMGPLSRATTRAGVEGLTRKADPTSISASDFFDSSDQVRREFAQLVGVSDPTHVAILPSVSYGMAIAAKNTPLANGQRVIGVSNQFPSDVYVWQKACERSGASFVQVSPGEGEEGRGRRWNERLLEAIDANTAAVVVPPVHWEDGTLFDLGALGRAAREVGARLIVDGTQSVGALPFDASRVQPDALICATYKWMLGPYGAALAYFAPCYHDGEPLEETWLGRERSDDFANLVKYQPEYRAGAARFDVGQRNDLGKLAMLSQALRELIERDPARVQSYCREWGAAPLSRLRELGFIIEDEAHRGAHLFGIRRPGGFDNGRLIAALDAESVKCSLRGESLRVSPNVYNDARDADALVRALSTLA